MKFGAGKKGSSRLSSSLASVLLLLVIVFGVCSVKSAGFSSLCDEEGDKQAGTMAGGLMGAPKEAKNSENSAEMEDIGKFAVQEHNTKEGKNFTFKKVVTAKTQVVAGTMYHLTLEVTHESSDQPKLYDAKVWTKPWENHKTLEHFKESETSGSVSSDTQEASGLRAVSVEDPVIKEAAEHAIEGLNKKSNSLVPYKLKEIRSARAEVGDEETKFQLRFTVSRGTKDEDMDVGLDRTADGKWTTSSSAILA